IVGEVGEVWKAVDAALLSRLGVGPSLQALARRSPIPVQRDVDLPERPAASMETAVYYVVSEALTNAVKHSQASEISVTISSREKLEASIVDDGVGGADPNGGARFTRPPPPVAAPPGRSALPQPPRGRTTSSLPRPVAP